MEGGKLFSRSSLWLLGAESGVDGGGEGGGGSGGGVGGGTCRGGGGGVGGDGSLWLPGAGVCRVRKGMGWGGWNQELEVGGGGLLW